MDLSSIPGATTLSRTIEAIDWVGVVNTVNGGVKATRVQFKRTRRSMRPTVVVTYRGWYDDGVVRLTARAVEKPVFSAGETEMGTGASLKANLRRFWVLGIADVTVKVTIGSHSEEATSDELGFLDIRIPMQLAPGWHVIDIDPVADGVSVPHTTGRVFVPDPAGGLAVVSDIDDTVLKTGLTQSWTVPLARSLLYDVTDRTPVPGMSAFYEAITRGPEGTSQTPFFYVSTGTWNYYDYLVAFLNLHRFPRGPLFLTDWSPSSERLMRDGREHKRQTIRALFKANPDLDFLLIGDVGQGDPETYELMAREHPGRVKAIFLVYVGSHLPERSEEVAARAVKLREEEGIPMYYASDAAEAATAAWQLGLVDKAATIEVAAAVQER